MNIRHVIPAMLFAIAFPSTLDADQATVDAMISVVRGRGDASRERTRAIEEVILECFRAAPATTEADRRSLTDDFVHHATAALWPLDRFDPEAFDIALDTLRWTASNASTLPVPTSQDEQLADDAIDRLSREIRAFVVEHHRDLPGPASERLASVAIGQVQSLRGRLVNRFHPELLVPDRDRLRRDDDLLQSQADLQGARDRLIPVLDMQQDPTIAAESKDIQLAFFVDREASLLASVAAKLLQSWFTPPPDIPLSMPEELIAKHKAHEAKAQERRRRAQEREATRPERAGGRRLLRDAGVIVVGGRPVPPRFADADADATSPPLVP